MSIGTPSCAVSSRGCAAASSRRRRRVRRAGERARAPDPRARRRRAPARPSRTRSGRHLQLAQVLLDSFAMSSLPNRAEIDARSPSESDQDDRLHALPGARPDAGAPRGAAMFFKDLTHVEHTRGAGAAAGPSGRAGPDGGQPGPRDPQSTCGHRGLLLVSRSAGWRPRSGRATCSTRSLAEVSRLNSTITSSLEFVRPICRSRWLSPPSQPVAGRRDRGGAGAARPLAGIASSAATRSGSRRVPAWTAVSSARCSRTCGQRHGGDGRRRDRVGSRSRRSRRAARRPPPVPGAGAPGPVERVRPLRRRPRHRTPAPESREEDQDKLFYPFFTTKKQGSGVGLSMARKIVDSHRGLIDVESRSARGRSSPCVSRWSRCDRRRPRA